MKPETEKPHKHEKGVKRRRRRFGGERLYRGQTPWTAPAGFHRFADVGLERRMRVGFEEGWRGQTGGRVQSKGRYDGWSSSCTLTRLWPACSHIFAP